MNWHKGTPDEAWDDSLFTSGGHFLQSSHWAAFNEALDKQVFYGRGAGWQCLAILEQTRTGKRLYCPYGPTAHDEEGFVAALDALRHLAHDTGALFARIEPVFPHSHVAVSGFKLKPALKNIQPSQTWVQKLTKSDDQLLADMTATNRNLYRNFATKGLSIRASTEPQEIKLFIAMMREVAANTRILQHTDHYYKIMAKTLLPRGAAKLYIAEHEGKPAATAFVFDSPTTRYYAHAASYSAARKFHPGTPLVVQMMLDAKKQGQTIFDFVGVAPIGQPHHSWAGFSAFKMSFGGEYKAYSGTWELPTHPMYRLYRGVYQMHKQLRFK